MQKLPKLQYKHHVRTYCLQSANTTTALKNDVIWDVTPCDSCKNNVLGERIT
jgi:hypothetical protein